HNHNVVLGSAQSQADDAAELRWVLETRHCDGLLLLGDLYDQPRLPADLMHPQRPVLALCVGPWAGDVPTVTADNAAGVELPLAPFVVPSLTTVRQPVTEMAELAVSQLLSMVDDEGFTAPAIQRLRPELIVRGSSGPPPS